MGKNIQRVQDMLDGNYKRKIQVGHERTEITREIGERWFDSDGKEWEQKNGYIASIKKTFLKLIQTHTHTSWALGPGSGPRPRAGTRAPTGGGCIDLCWFS